MIANETIIRKTLVFDNGLYTIVMFQKEKTV